MLNELKKDKIRLLLYLIIVLEIIILMCLTVYRVNEFKNSNKEVIKDEQNKDNGENNLNNEKEEESNNNKEVQTKEKIKILVDQINIREAANETSKDIGDVFINEVFDVLDIIDTTHYTWYKINKEGITGYVASKKDAKWIEYNGTSDKVENKDNIGNEDSKNNMAYKCVSSDCKVHDSKLNVELIYDENKLFVINYDTQKKQYININYKKNNPYPYKIIEYNGKIYGVVIESDGFGGGLYYSIKQNKIILDSTSLLNENNSYKRASVDISLDLPYLIFSKYWSLNDGTGIAIGGPAFRHYENHKIEIFDIRSEEVLITIDKAPALHEVYIDQIKYFVAPHIGKIYNSNYENIKDIKFDSINIQNIGCWEATSHYNNYFCSQWNYKANNNKTLTLISENRYIVYDSNMNQKYKSEIYDQFYLIEDYIITTKDEQLYLLDLEGHIIKAFELKDNKNVITGVIHESENEEIFEIAINDEIIYYYTPNTNTSGVRNINS